MQRSATKLDLFNEDLETQIGLRIGFEGLGENLNERGGDRQRNASFTDLKQRAIEMEKKGATNLRYPPERMVINLRFNGRYTV